jgi:hypothetical protein
MMWQNFIDGNAPRHLYIEDVGPSADWAAPKPVKANKKDKSEKSKTPNTAGNMKAGPTEPTSSENFSESSRMLKSDNKADDSSIQKDVTVEGTLSPLSRASSHSDSVLKVRSDKQGSSVPTSVPAYQDANISFSDRKRCKKCRCRRRPSPYSAAATAALCRLPICKSSTGQ